MSRSAWKMALGPRSASQRRNTRLRCDCMAYWFPHRKGGGACDHSTRRLFYALIREGVPESEAMADLSAADLDRMYPLPPQQPQAPDAPIPF